MGQGPNGAQAMVVGGDYPTPVYVNGYACNNCAQVAEAKQDINPADPQAGPGGIDAKNGSNASQGPAFTLGGVLANAPAANGAAVTEPSAAGLSASGAAANGAAPNGSAAGQPASQSSSPTQGVSNASGLGGLLNISV